MKYLSDMEPNKMQPNIAGVLVNQQNNEISSHFASSMFDSVTPFEVLMVEELSDLNLIIGTNIITVHQLILASHSSMLAGEISM